jgi:phosphoribosylcarboxyaminoimidazole (NCAIR) mutase
MSSTCTEQHPGPGAGGSKTPHPVLAVPVISASALAALQGLLIAATLSEQ